MPEDIRWRGSVPGGGKNALLGLQGGAFVPPPAEPAVLWGLAPSVDGPGRLSRPGADGVVIFPGGAEITLDQ